MRSLLLALIAALGVFIFAGSAEGEQPPLREYRNLMEKAKTQGLDIREAELLDHASRAAARKGDHAEAAKLLSQAVESLRKQVSESEAQPEQPRQRPAGKQAPIQGERPATPTAATTGPQQPVFLMPFTHHYDGPGGYYPSAAEVRRMGEFFAKNKIPGTMFFDGILVERLQKEDPDLIRQVRDWNLPLGYHGEETHGPYPVASELLGEVHTLREAQGYNGPWSLTTGRNWDTAVQLVEERYSFTRPYRVDESTRMIDRRQPSETDRSRTGGLKLVQQAFGKDVAMMTSHGLESAPEGYVFRKMSRFGFDQPAVPIALHALRIFRIGDVAEKVMKIAGENESIFWYMGRLNSKGDDVGEAGYQTMPLRRKLESLDRSRPRLLLTGFSKVDEQQGSRTARYLAEEFFPANPGSGWVTGDTLPGFFEPEKGYAPTAADVAAMAKVLSAGWKGRPPDMVAADNRVFSLCDAFEAMARALAGRTESGTLPQSVTIHALYGPVMEEDAPLLRKGAAITREMIRTAARAVIKDLDQATGDRFIPARVTAGGTAMNCAEFMNAMALALSQGGTEPLAISGSQAFPPYADLLQVVFKPKAVQPLCYTKGQLWTVKPARLKGEAEPALPSSTAVPAPAPAAGTPAAAVGLTERLQLVFAANLDSEEPCHRDSHAGGDLYRAEIDLAKGQASNLRRLTSRAGVAEWFPALAPDLKVVVYDQEDRIAPGRSRAALRALSLETGADSLLASDDRCAAFSLEGKTFYFSRQMRGAHKLLMAPIQPDGRGSIMLGSETVISDTSRGEELVEDPAPFPDGKSVAFHRKVDNRSGAQLAVVNADGSGVQSLSPGDGCGHATVSPDGNIVACTRSRDGHVVLVRRQRERWLSPEDLPLSDKPSDYAGYDKRFGQMREVRHSYLQFIAPSMLLLTTHGAEGVKDFRMARLFLLKLGDGDQRPQIIDLSTPIEVLAGKTGKDFCSADGRLTRE